MNVLQTCFSKGWGGLEMYPIRLHPFLKSHAINNFFAIRKNSSLNKTILEKGYQHISLDWKNFFLLRLIYLIKYIKTNNINLVHCHKSSDLFYIVLSKYFCNFKLVFTEHMGGKREKKDLYHRWIYKNVDLIFSISNEVKKRNIKALPIDPKKIVTIYLGLDLKRYKPKLNEAQKKKIRKQFGLPEKAFLIGLPGRLSPGKGQDTLLDALEIINSEYNVALIFIGGTKKKEGANEQYIQKLKERIKKNKLQNKVFFSGFQTKIPEIIECLDIACIPSYNEAFGLTVIESMAMNVPIVASRAGGIPELLDDTKEGLLFTPKNKLDLSEKISFLINNEELAKSYAKNALLKVQKTFSQKQHVDRVTENYKKLTL